MDIIILNIGGTKFITTRSTLTKYPDTMLGRFFASDNETIAKPNFSDSLNPEQYFFDRDPKYFGYILNWYRTGELCNYDKNELDYWCIPHISRNGLIEEYINGLINANDYVLRGKIVHYVPDINEKPLTCYVDNDLIKPLINETLLQKCTKITQLHPYLRSSDEQFNDDVIKVCIDKYKSTVLKYGTLFKYESDRNYAICYLKTLGLTGVWKEQLIMCGGGDFRGINSDNVVYSYFPFGKLPACDFCDQCIVAYVDDKIMPHVTKHDMNKFVLTICQ